MDLPGLKTLKTKEKEEAEKEKRKKKKIILIKKVLRKFFFRLFIIKLKYA